MSKQIILFDVDGVLVHGYHARTELRKCWDEHLQRDFGIDQKKFEKDFIYGTFVQNVIIGKKTLYEELKNWLPGAGYAGDPQTFIDYWLRNDAHVNQPLIDKIKILKQSGQTRLFIATNQEHNRAQFLMKEMGFADLFEDIFYSGRIGFLKPDKAYFDWISAHLQLMPDQRPIFFDDTPKVVIAACAYGWEAIEFLSTEDIYRSPFVRSILEKIENNPTPPLSSTR